MGRPKTTGRYATREELEESALQFYYESTQNVSQIAKTCGVSDQTVHTIIRERSRQRTLKRLKERIRRRRMEEEKE